MDNLDQNESVTEPQGNAPAHQDDHALLLQILAELRLLSERILEVTAFQKPILTIDEASQLLGMSKKRLEDIIYEEKTRLGRLPDFVCDANGMIRRHILKDQLIEWVTKRRVRRGRPMKSLRD